MKNFSVTLHFRNGDTRTVEVQAASMEQVHQTFIKQGFVIFMDTPDSRESTYYPAWALDKAVISETDKQPTLIIPTTRLHH